jgi:membrane protein DedA with SNARE-associated domain
VLVRAAGHGEAMSRAAPVAAESQELTGLAGWVVDVVAALGPVGVGLLVALENLFPPIPSEVVLPLAGFLAGQGRMALPVVVAAATVGSVVGALLLYALGARIGRDRLGALLDRTPLTGHRDLARAERWFERHGAAAVLTGRMVPVVRSLVSVPAGVERMPLLRFTLYTAVGSAGYNTVLVLLGYVLGRQWRSVGEYSSLLSYAIAGAVGLALVVGVVRRLRSRART